MHDRVVLSVSSEPGYIRWDQIHFKQPLITELLKMEDNSDAQPLPNDDINSSAPGGDFQSVLDDDMVPFEQVRTT